MSAADVETSEAIQGGSTSVDGSQSRDAADPFARQTYQDASMTDESVPVPQPRAPKKRMIITHDKYIQLQSLIVLHLSATERDTGRGIDRDELIDWYLELKESEIQTIEELEYEKDLIIKMLKKLVKVGPPSLLFSTVNATSRTTTFWKSKGMYKNHCHQWMRAACNHRFRSLMRMCASIIWFIQRWIRRVHPYHEFSSPSYLSFLYLQCFDVYMYTIPTLHSPVNA
jgi:hypothetical protein